MQVEHVEDENRFVVRLDDEEAELTYLRAGPKLIDIQHTYVPEDERGHGVAEALAAAVTPPAPHAHAQPSLVGSPA